MVVAFLDAIYVTALTVIDKWLSKVLECKHFYPLNIISIY